MNMPNNQAAGNNSLKAIFDNFPKLLEAKRAGKLAKEQETLVSWVWRYAAFAARTDTF